MKILTIPNIITIIRIILMPVFIILFFSKGFIYKLSALIVFLVAAVSDYIDGKLARKHNMISEFGKFLDPLADKILVLTTLFLFVEIKEFYIPRWLIFLIASREIFITGLRIFFIKEKKPMKTSNLGKLKTGFQLSSIIIILIMLCIRTFIIERKYHLFARKEARLLNLKNVWDITLGGAWAGILKYLPLFLIAVTTIITVLSGIHYVLKIRKHSKR